MTVESIGDLLWDSQLEYYQFDMLAGITLDMAHSTPGHNVVKQLSPFPTFHSRDTHSLIHLPFNTLHPSLQPPHPRPQP